MVKRKQHIGMFLHNEMGVSWGGMSLMCGRSSIHPQKIFFLRSIVGTGPRLVGSINDITKPTTVNRLASLYAYAARKGERVYPYFEATDHA